MSVLRAHRPRPSQPPRLQSSRAYDAPVPTEQGTGCTSFVPRTYISLNALLTLLRAIATEQTAVVSPVSPNLLPRPALVKLFACSEFTFKPACTYATSLLFASSGMYDKTLSVDSAAATDQHYCVRGVVRRSEIAVTPQWDLRPLDQSSARHTSCMHAGPGASAIAHESRGVPCHGCVL